MRTFFGLEIILLFEVNIECIKFIFQNDGPRSFNMSTFYGLYGIRHTVYYMIFVPMIWFAFKFGHIQLLFLSIEDCERCTMDSLF